jgi:hypothetical protein
MKGTQLFVPAMLAALAACGGDDSGNDACNPLGGAGCLLPWPSMAYVKTDATSATGFRLDLPLAAMPTNGDGSTLDPKGLNRWDGFSPTGPILVSFPSGISGDGLPSYKDPDQSLAADSPIILVDEATGERAPFFAEIDQNVTDPLKRNLVIRPLARLHTKARYAVGIKNTVKAADGSALQPSAGFIALRDGKSFSNSRFAAVAEHADEMFAALAAAGADKSSLVLAWDYVTASDEFLRSDLTAMRDAALPLIGANGANLSFTTTEQSPVAGVYKRYLGTFKSPDFLTNGENPDSILRRDADGKPQAMGMRDAQLAAIIPQCATTASGPLPTIVFGHGLFGSAKGYLDDTFVQNLAETNCFVILAGDFIGLTERQLELAPLAVNDMNRGTQITEKLAQALIDFISLENAARGPMATSPAFMVNGHSVIDTTKIYYVGGSLGGIMGNAFMAYDPNITRGVLAVPGGIWSLLLERSAAWHALLGAAQGAYEDPEVYQLNLAFLGMGFEPYDPVTTAAHVLKDPLPGVPAKKILIWYTLGDCLVTNISTEVIARTMGIDVLAPSVRMPWHLTAKTGPLESGVMIFDDHPTPLPPETNVPPAVDNGTHSGINRKPAALRAVKSFLIDGEAVQACGTAQAPAACDCATGACN